MLCVQNSFASRILAWIETHDMTTVLFLTIAFVAIVCFYTLAATWIMHVEGVVTRWWHAQKEKEAPHDAPR